MTISLLIRQPKLARHVTHQTVAIFNDVLHGRKSPLSSGWIRNRRATQPSRHWASPKVAIQKGQDRVTNGRVLRRFWRVSLAEPGEREGAVVRPTLDGGTRPENIGTSAGVAIAIARQPEGEIGLRLGAKPAGVGELGVSASIVGWS
ncbi:MAG: hypothetical protein H7A53_05770 [Akkermansiaceae bacterium]|nr:hypothetical protein [Akkermansiaceae bacterium]